MLDPAHYSPQEKTGTPHRHAGPSTLLASGEDWNPSPPCWTQHTTRLTRRLELLTTMLDPAHYSPHEKTGTPDHHAGPSTLLTSGEDWNPSPPCWTQHTTRLTRSLELLTTMLDPAHYSPHEKTGTPDHHAGPSTLLASREDWNP